MKRDEQKYRIGFSRHSARPGRHTDFDQQLSRYCSDFANTSAQSRTTFRWDLRVLAILRLSPGLGIDKVALTPPLLARSLSANCVRSRLDSMVMSCMNEEIRSLACWFCSLRWASVLFAVQSSKWAPWLTSRQMARRLQKRPRHR